MITYEGEDLKNNPPKSSNLC